MLIDVGCNISTNPDLKKVFGNALLKINIETSTVTITQINISLIKPGTDSIYVSEEIVEGNRVEVLISDLKAGYWELTVEALDSDDDVRFAGVSLVNIQIDNTTPIRLQLEPVAGKTGGVIINLSWNNDHLYWLDNPQNPLVKKLNTSLDNYGVRTAYLIKDADEYKMWFSGGSENSESSVFGARSGDGLAWERMGYSPVLSKGTSGSWDSQHVGAGPVIKIDGVYYMYYSGWSDYRYQWHIGLATSYDGLIWVKKNYPVLNAGNSYDYRIGAHSVIKVGNQYLLYYGGQSQNNNRWAEYIAISNDGINWTKAGENPVLEPEENWENIFSSHTSVIYENRQFKMFYEGRNTNNVGAFGLAYSDDGFNWIKYPGNPIITSSDIIFNNYTNLAYPCFIKVDDEYRIYYTGIKSLNEAEICLFRRISPNLE